MKVGDFKRNRERFEGYGLAFMMKLIEGAQKVDTTKFPDQPVFAALKDDLKMIATVESAKLQKALKAATAMPADMAVDVFAAYADGLKKDTVTYAMSRLADNQTAQICLFLILARPWIESAKVPSVTVLFEGFMKIKQAFPRQKEFFDEHPEARRSLKAQFRNICSADGVKIRGRGRPRKIQPAKL